MERRIEIIAKNRRFHTGMKSLRSLSIIKIVDMLVKYELPPSFSLKTLIPSLVDELFQSTFDDRYLERYGILTELIPDKRQFEIWLLFFDEKKTKSVNPIISITPEFCFELITFLERNVTHLESIRMYYNWILNKTYINAFKNLPHLKHLEVLGYMDDTLLRIISDNCQLETFNLRSDLTGFQRRSYGMTSAGISAFFRSQKNSIQKINLLQIYCSKFYIGDGSSPPLLGFKSNLDDFYSMEHIKSLTLCSDMFILITKKIRSVSDLVISFDKSTKVSFERNIFESVLSICPNVQKVSFLELKLYSKSGLMNDHLSDIVFNENKFIQAIRGKLGEIVSEISICLYGTLNWSSILNNLPNVEKAFFVVESDTMDSNNLSVDKIPEVWNSLTSLSVSGGLYKCDFHADLQPVLVLSPKLSKCTLNFYGLLTNFNENEFLQRLQYSSLRSLQHLEFILTDKTHAMTGRTVQTLLTRCLKLQFLKNVSSFCNLTHKEVCEIENMAVEMDYAMLNVDRMFSRF